MTRPVAAWEGSSKRRAVNSSLKNTANELNADGDNGRINIAIHHGRESDRTQQLDNSNKQFIVPASNKEASRIVHEIPYKPERQVWTMDLSLMPLTQHLLAIRPKCSSSVKDCCYLHTVLMISSAWMTSNSILSSDVAPESSSCRQLHWCVGPYQPLNLLPTHLPGKITGHFELAGKVRTTERAAKENFREK
ncbi:hypothetical protein CapIbe_005358 [Capra ibex]